MTRMKQTISNVDGSSSQVRDLIQSKSVTLLHVGEYAYGDNQTLNNCIYVEYDTKSWYSNTFDVKVYCKGYGLVDFDMYKLKTIE